VRHLHPGYEGASTMPNRGQYILYVKSMQVVTCCTEYHLVCCWLSPGIAAHRRHAGALTTHERLVMLGAVHNLKRHPNIVTKYSESCTGVVCPSNLRS
jgi:hypothetical protein